MLPKPEGWYRWVVDLRGVNKDIQEPNANQLPKVNDFLMTTHGAAIISFLDIKDTCMQIELDDLSKPKTAFYVPGRGLYQFKRMPAGLKDAARR